MTEHEKSTAWVLGGTGAVIALYQLFKPNFGESGIMPVPAVESPSSFQDLNAVATRFGQVRELYRMGYLSAIDTFAQLDGLLTAINSLQVDGQADSATVVQLTSSINAFIDDLNVA